MTSLRKDSRINGRPIQNATTVVKNTYTSAIQNSAFGTVTPKTVSGPASPHRIGVNETTLTMAKTVPNSSVWDVPTDRRVGSLAGAGGEEVDVLLDALIGVVDRVIDEASAVVGVTVEPVAGEPLRQPHAPPDDEPLHQVDVEQVADDVR